MPYPQELEKLITEMATAGVSDEDIQSVADQFLAEHGPTPPSAATGGMLPPSRVGRDPGMPIAPGIVGQAFQGAGGRIGEMIQGVGQIPGMIGKNVSDFAANPRETLASYPGAALEGMGSLVEGVAETGANLLSGDPRRMGSGAVDAATMAPLARLMGRGAVSGARATAATASRASQRSPLMAAVTGDEGGMMARLRRYAEGVGDPDIAGTQARRDYVLRGSPRSEAPTGAPTEPTLDPRINGGSTPPGPSASAPSRAPEQTIAQVARLGDVKGMAARLRELELKPIRSMLEEQEYQALYRMVNKGAQTGGLTSAATGRWE